ncbi:hypothetical protein [Rubrivirga sp. IMCC45206]|uniref:hypothetical protein n=1 Tax=Rubrivirga sp. IMCC45206 TaxID=3391614 RepID=UPI00398FD6AB
MRAGLAILLLVASAALAPPAGAQADGRPSHGQRAAMALAGGALGVGAAVGTYALLYPASDTGPGVALVAAAYPVGVAAGTVLVDRAVGSGTPAQAVLADAIVGTVVGGTAGLVIGGAAVGVGYLATGGDGYALILPALVGALAGTAVAVGVSTWRASSGVRLAPAALAAPSGERGAGVSLSIPF